MSATESIPTATNGATAEATRLLAEVRSKCVALGLTPREFADLLLPEALLAMMVSGMREEEVKEAFARFARDEIGAWFLQVKRTAGYCDCEREAFAEHAASCGSKTMMPVAEYIADGVERNRSVDVQDSWRGQTPRGVGIGKNR